MSSYQQVKTEKKNILSNNFMQKSKNNIICGFCNIFEQQTRTKNFLKDMNKNIRKLKLQSIQNYYKNTNKNHHLHLQILCYNLK